MKVLFLYDKYGNLTKHPISNHYSYFVHKEINVLDSIEFKIHRSEPCYDEIELEGYVRTEDGMFIIKEKNVSNDDICEVYATLDIDEFKGQVVKEFKSSAGLKTQISNLLSGTGYTAQYHFTPSSDTNEHNINFADKYSILQSIVSSFDVEVRFDNVGKVLHIYDAGTYGTNRGVYFFEDVNINSFAIESNSQSLINRLVAYGKDGITTTVTNEQFLPLALKTVSGIWSDERYITVDTLKKAAQIKLATLSTPAITYQLTIRDLQKAKPSTQDIFDFDLGDTVLVSAKGIKTKQRVVKIDFNEDNPEKTQIELSNATAHLQSQLADNNKLLHNLDNRLKAIGG